MFRILRAALAVFLAVAASALPAADYPTRPVRIITPFAANPLGIGPVVYPNLPYEARRDFAPVSLLATTPEVLVVNAASELRTAADLAAHARKQPRKLNYGSAGSGTLAHLAAESFNQRTAMNAVHVAYKGSAPALTDLLGGQVDWLFDSPAAILPGLQAGKLRALAAAARAAGVKAD